MSGTLLPGLPGPEWGVDSPSRDFRGRFLNNRTAVASLIFIMLLAVTGILAPVISPYDPCLGGIAPALDRPSVAHPLGTDEQGRDILSRTIFGARISFAVGLLAAGTALVAGTILGALAAYYGGWLNNLIMWFIDIMRFFPPLLLAVFFMAALGRGMENAIIAIGAALAPEYAGIARGAVLQVMEYDYIKAARAVGNRDSGIFLRHVLPNITAPILVRAVTGVSTAILATAALGFLGLCVQQPSAEWGTMLGTGRDFIFYAPHIVFPPGLAITSTALAFNLLGSGLGNALCPGRQWEWGIDR